MDFQAEERATNAIVARNSFRRKIRSKEKARYRRQHNIKIYPSLHTAPQYKEWVNIPVPETLCLDQYYDETVGLLATIRRTALRLKQPVRLDFSETKSIKPSALLILLAEINRCRIIQGPRRFTGSYPEHEKLERMMCATGFFALLGVKPRILVKRTYPMEYIRFTTDIKLNEMGASHLRANLLGDKIKMEMKSAKRLHRAVTEAMLNSKQHAYPEGRRSAHPGKRWWMYGHFNRKTKSLTILFCDLGVGIPATVEKIYVREQILAVLSTLPGIQISDGYMIKAAMALGRTRTGVDGRGRGLNDLRKFVDHAGEGELAIFSKKGVYKYKAGGEEHVADYQSSIGGTLIRWTVPIEKVTDWSGEEYEDHDAQGH